MVGSTFRRKKGYATPKESQYNCFMHSLEEREIMFNSPRGLDFNVLFLKFHVLQMTWQKIEENGFLMNFSEAHEKK